MAAMPGSETSFEIAVENIDATLAALRTYGAYPIHLILGGDDKGVELEELFTPLKKYEITIYAIGANVGGTVTLTTIASATLAVGVISGTSVPITGAADPATIIAWGQSKIIPS